MWFPQYPLDDEEELNQQGAGMALRICGSR